MARPPRSRPVSARSDPVGGSVIGSIGLVALLAAALVAASYPQLTLATALGAVGARLARRGARVLRSRWGERRLNGLPDRARVASRDAPIRAHRD